VLELALRVGAIAVLGWTLWLATRADVTALRRERVEADALRARLAAWTRDGAPDSIRVALDSLPDDSLLDWLVALRRAGAAVGWSGDIAPIALVVEPVNAPAGGVRVLAAAPGDTVIALRDAAGPLATVRAASVGVGARVPALAASASATLGRTVARGVARDSVLPGAVLVLGTVGWEARYVIAALEESGWRVDARLTIAPGLEVRRGTPAALDSVRYGAVLVLDSAGARDARRIAAFAQSGGGVVLSGIAAGLPALRDIAPGTPGARVRPAVVAFTADAPRRALAFLPVARAKGDALALEARDGRVAVAARREGAGRVLQVGYDESWRWRMQGGEAGLEAHRRWWSDAVASVALRRSLPIASSGSGRGAAPRASLFSALGPPAARTQADAAGAGPRRGLRPWMLVLGLMLLLAEWTSRRLRGAA
jgi:hypothetical protein